jgi:hypothetical protein
VIHQFVCPLLGYVAGILIGRWMGMLTCEQQLALAMAGLAGAAGDWDVNGLCGPDLEMAS